MPTTIEVATGADSTPTEYTEDGFVLSVGQPHSQSGQTPDGLTISTDGGETYLVTTYSNTEVFLEAGNAGAFGLLSIQLDGFINSSTSGGITRGNPAPVTFTFTGINPNLLLPVTASFTTDSVSGFQTFVLPADFAAGLIQVSWTATDGTNVWGGFDNLVLQTNSAPTATGIDDSTVQADGSVTGHLGGDDADGDLLTFEIGGLVEGVTVLPDGSFTVGHIPADDELLPGQFRNVTFTYTVSDGVDVSAGAAVTVQVFALPQGADIRGGNHPQKLVGTAAGERIWGGNSGDTLCGLGGADTLDGANGTDVLNGGDGRDRLLGGNGSDTLDGGAGNDSLNGGNSPDVLYGGFGDDTFTGGASPDEFYLGPNWVHDVITDFDPKNEHIHLTPSPTLGSWNDVKNSMTQVGKDVLIDDHAGNTLLLQNVKLSSLGADDFIFG